MKKVDLDKFLGKKVTIKFKDTVNSNKDKSGVLTFIPEFSAKYGYVLPNYYHVDDTCFKASHVKKVIVLN